MSLILTIGLPGAGKSTWAADNLDSTTCRLERDRFRECIFGTRRAYHESPLRHDQRQEVIDRAMMATMQTWPYLRWAVTDTNLELSRCVMFLEHARTHGVPIELVIFDMPWEVIAHRNRIRPEPERVPEHILHERLSVFLDPAAWWRKDFPAETGINKTFVDIGGGNG